MILSLADIARVAGSAVALSGAVSGYSIDSRTIQPGEIFFAIRGETFDGHDFIEQVFEKGAVAAVVDREVPAAGPLMRVPDVLVALQNVATWTRQRWNGDVVAVTGSAGKTTTKDIITALLSPKIAAGKTTGNFNNHIGLPLSILRLPDDIRVAVLELGMNHAGEIRDLAKIAQPNIGVVTNVGYAHVENFDSIEGVAAAKRELVEALPPSGVAVLNIDDPRVRRFGDHYSGRVITFGTSEAADVLAQDITMLESGSRFRVGTTRFETSLLGRHGIRNILAGIAVAQVFGIQPAELTETVRSLAPGKMRGERITTRGMTVINDCYNSNPDAARGMIEVLRDIPAQRHIAVLGEMLELGRWAEPLHRDVGRYAAECGISVLVGIRGAARSIVDGAIESGLAMTAAYFFPSPEEAGEAIRRIAQPGDAILFKGSRGTRVERALEAFLA
jgi:UDP-N-acetylmuramoyl-tripeptide--D-alanyl-D-alanine ligase